MILSLTNICNFLITGRSDTDERNLYLGYLESVNFTFFDSLNVHYLITNLIWL